MQNANCWKRHIFEHRPNRSPRTLAWKLYTEHPTKTDVTNVSIQEAENSSTETKPHPAVDAVRPPLTPDGGPRAANLARDPDPRGLLPLAARRGCRAPRPAGRASSPRGTVSSAGLREDQPVRGLQGDRGRVRVPVRGEARAGEPGAAASPSRTYRRRCHVQGLLPPVHGGLRARGPKLAGPSRIPSALTDRLPARPKELSQ